VARCAQTIWSEKHSGGVYNQGVPGIKNSWEGSIKAVGEDTDECLCAGGGVNG